MNDNVRKKKKRRKKNYVLRLLIVVALGAGLFYFLSSSYFDVHNVVVENNNYYTREQIISKSEAKTGENIFKANTGEIKALLLLDPYIKNTRVKRTLPDTIVITVEERSESAAVPYSDMYIIIDRDGMVLRKSEIEPQKPLLLGLTIKTMEEGKPLEVEETANLTLTLKIVETMERTGMFFKKIDISKVIIRAYIYDRLICEGTPENILDSMENGNLKIFYNKLYTEGTERGIIYVGNDNSFSFNPMVE